MVWFDGGEVCEGGVWLMRTGGGERKLGVKRGRGSSYGLCVALGEERRVVEFAALDKHIIPNSKLAHTGNFMEGVLGAVIFVRL